MREYHIRIRGHLPADWSDFVAGAQPQNLPGGDCLLVTNLPDQAALFGILSRLNGLGLYLVSVNPAQEARVPPHA